MYQQRRLFLKRFVFTNCSRKKKKDSIFTCHNCHKHISSMQLHALILCCSFKEEIAGVALPPALLSWHASCIPEFLVFCVSVLYWCVFVCIFIQASWETAIPWSTLLSWCRSFVLLLNRARPWRRTSSADGWTSGEMSGYWIHCVRLYPGHFKSHKMGTKIQDAR